MGAKVQVLESNLILLQSWFERAFGHVQNAQPDAEGIFNDGTLSYGDIERFDEHAAAFRRESVHSRDHIIYQIMDFNP